MSPNRSQQPLTLAELVNMVDRSLEGGGAAMSHLIWNVENGADPPSEFRDFVRVSSEFYPQLAAYYDDRIATWLAEHRHAHDQEADPH